MSLQQLQVTRLDLSYNKITGEYLHAEFDSRNYSNVVLSVNRLSGKVPSTVERVKKLDMLSGNVFSCSGLPRNDVHRETYSCGSSESNQSLFLLVSIIGVCIIALAIILYSVHYVILEDSALYALGTWARVQWNICCFAHEKTSVLGIYRNILFFNTSLSTIAWTELCIIGVSWVCCIPLYALKIRDDGKSNADYAVLTHMYGWLLSAAYVTGTTPAAILLGTWIAAVTLLVTVCTRYFDHREEKIAMTPQNSTMSHLSSFCTSDSMWTALALLLNGIVVVSVNALYVYSTILHLSPTVHLWIQIAVAVFKYIYNFIFVPAVFLVRRDGQANHTGVWLKLMILMFNSIVIPALVTMITDPSCYQVYA